MRNGCVVPPLRRLISIAYGVQLAVSVDHDEVEGEPPDDPLLASRSPTSSPRLLIARA